MRRRNHFSNSPTAEGHSKAKDATEGGQASQPEAEAVRFFTLTLPLVLFLHFLIFLCPVSQSLRTDIQKGPMWALDSQLSTLGDSGKG